MNTENTGPWPRRVNVIGVGVSAISIPVALEQIDRWIANKCRQYVCVADVHAVMQSRWDPAFRRIHNKAGMVTPDGMPLVWLCRSRHPDVSRVYGPDLMLAACGHGVARGTRHYLFGGDDGVAGELAASLTLRFPGIEICGTWTPPFRPLTPEEIEETVARINQAAPDIVWVGLGTPKQEKWMDQFRARLDAPVLVGVGAAFDFLSGRKPQAPALIRRSGLEWLFRLATEPKRLWPRYRRVIPGFLFALACQKLRPWGFRIE
jgi:N-acetylglucosaminyldiphosphoundecaprenol N-acetyl-beta-D-mannosaminyltransferase